MLKFKICLIALTLIFTFQPVLKAQEAEEEQEAPATKKQEIIEIGLSYDYLKAHTFLLDDRDKFEFALNIDIYDKISLVASLGNASLRPEDEYKNAQYKSEGNYYRLGLDYIMYINPDNLLFLGLRYSQSKYDESIIYEASNPLFDNQNGDIYREDLSADWMELVITSEKKVKKLFNQDLKDFLRIGFKFRVKTNLNYDEFEFANTRLIPGYGLTNTKINPELNLYLKFRVGLNKSKAQ